MARQESIAFVTGAGAGIGQATTRRLLEAGVRVVGLDKDVAQLQTLAESGHTDRLLVCRADVFSEADRHRAIDAAIAKFGSGPDILINCVGGSTILPKADMPLVDMTESQWDAMMVFNLKGAFLCCHDVIPLMVKQGRGTIINVTSFTGRAVLPDASVAYATAKAGLVGFTRRLSKELAPDNIRCNAVAPGFVMTRRIKSAIWDAVGPEGRKGLQQRIPLGRFAEPEEIAAAIMFLASDDSSYMTGAILDCNGGLL